MNIIASLIPVDPDTAERVVEDLSDLFRASLNEAGNLVPIKHELDLCRRYVHIEQLRLGNRLQVEWQIADLPEDANIPLLTLQPLVENAIYHGVQSRTEGGTVTIKLSTVGNRVSIQIANPYTDDGSDPNQKGNRMALDNIRNRLHALYGETASLTHQIEEGIYRATLTVPRHINRAESL